MSRTPVEIIVVCEDRRQYDFICFFLMKYYRWQKSHLRRVLRHSNFPKDGSGGAGEKHVRDTYPIELKSLRSNSILVAVMDADNDSVAAHHAELDVAAECAGLKRIVDEFSDEDSTLNKTVKGIKKGAAIAQDIVRAYGAISGFL